MSFIMIGGQPVFLSEACYSSIKESVLKDKTPEYRAGSCIKGTSAQIETNKLIRDYLIQQHANNKNFYDNWVWFAFFDSEAEREGPIISLWVVLSC